MVHYTLNRDLHYSLLSDVVIFFLNRVLTTCNLKPYRLYSDIIPICNLEQENRQASQDPADGRKAPISTLILHQKVVEKNGGGGRTFCDVVFHCTTGNYVTALQNTLGFPKILWIVPRVSHDTGKSCNAAKS